MKNENQHEMLKTYNGIGITYNIFNKIKSLS